VTRTPLDALRRSVDPALAGLLERVLAEAERRDVALHLVGGPVRDLLLGRALRDLDLLVEPRDGSGVGAEELARAAGSAAARIVSHDRFGTVRLADGGAALDLATARSERYPRPGALPVVAPGALDDDLRRRDFTLNALAIPLTSAARRGRGAVIDPATGRDDLAAGVLRIFHAQSFHDDPTRALRAARLAARLGLRLSRASRSALRDAIGAGAFGAVSGERLRREIEKLFEDARLGADPALALRLLAEWHVLGALEPGLGLPPRALPGLRRLGRALAEPPMPALRVRPAAAGLALWLADLDATSRRRTLRRLAVRGELAQRIAEHPKLRDRTLRSLARARGRGAVDALLAGVDDDRLLALFAGAPPPSRRRILRWTNEDRARRAPLGGNDLVAAGLSGPAVGAALARVRLAWLDGTVRSREEALALAAEVAAQVARRKPRRANASKSARPGGSRRARSAAASLPGTDASPILPPASPPPRPLLPERT
jgi:tRNA nucleotidyltransferase (CCA-adding enzyme)